MEVGDATESGDPALFAKLDIFWQPKDRLPLPQIYHDLIKLRKEQSALTNDRVIWLPNDQDSQVVSFMRLNDSDEFVVVINFSNRPINSNVTLKDGDGFLPVKISGFQNSNSGPLPAVHLNGFEWRIYHRGPTTMAAK